MSVNIAVPTLYIVPSVDLLRQNEQAILDEGGDVGVYCGSLGRKEVKPLTIATINSLKDAEEFKEKGFKFLIVDEAHYKCSEDGMFKEFYDRLKPKKLLGLTATAFKLKLQNGFYSLVMLNKLRPKIFQDIIHVTQVSEVIKAGRWSELEYENHLYNGSKLVMNSGGTEYSQESIINTNESELVNRRLVKRIKEIITSEKTAKVLVFTDSVDTAQIIENWINSKFDIKCAIVTDKTSQKDRKGLVDKFKDVTSNTNVLINFGTFTTGFDCPSLKYCLMGRPTMSFALYSQIVGRLVRVFKGKKKGVFIDFCGNIDRFGKIENVVYKNVDGYGWGVFSGMRLMTGVPILSNKIITERDLLCPPPLKSVDMKYLMPFGKHEGTPVSKIPKHYRDFMLEKFDFENNTKLKQILEDLRDNDFLKLLQNKKRG